MELCRATERESWKLSVRISDPNFPRSPDGTMRNTQQYYYQVQHQVMVTDTFLCYFYVWTEGQCPVNFLLVVVQKDVKFKYLFKQAILPEILTRKGDCANQNAEKYYCFCFQPMIVCSGNNCRSESYHYTCVNIKRKPKGNWLCKDS